MDVNPNQKNVLKEMLAKGDTLRPKYADFDFEKLDDKQIQFLKSMTIFPRYRKRIEAWFEPEKVSNEMKVIFLEQHSMKLGNNRFYELEERRQHIRRSVEDYPSFACLFGFFWFIYFAYRRPVTSTLYKEVFYSGVLGAMCAAPRVYYWRWNYMKEVSKQFAWLQERFEQDPSLNVPDDEDVLKNFGAGDYNQMGEDDNLEEYREK